MNKGKIKNIITGVASAVISCIATVIAFFILNRQERESSSKKEIENEIRETSAADIVSMSDNQSDIQRTVSNEKEQLRKRIADRFYRNYNNRADAESDSDNT